MVKCVVCFGSSAIIKSPVPQMHKMLQEKGITVSEKDLHVKDRWDLFTWDIPTKRILSRYDVCLCLHQKDESRDNKFD